MKRLCALLLLCSATAWSQVPDTLISPVRKARRAAVSLETGLNSLASLGGVKGTVFLGDQVAVDLGLALSSVTGLRPGVYVRYLLDSEPTSSFVYGGFKYALGGPLEVKDSETGVTHHLKVDPSSFVDFGLGGQILNRNGFLITSGLGWSWLIGDRNHSWEGSRPSSDLMTRLALGSGPALFVSLGWAF